MGDVGKSLRAMTLMLETLTGRVNAVESKSRFDEADRLSELGEPEPRSSGVTQRRSQDALPPAGGARRESAWGKMLSETELAADRHHVVVNMAPPSHKHIYLNSTNLADYLQMVTQWIEWQARYGIKLETSQVISTNVKHILMYKNDMTDVQFNGLTPQEFCKLMAKETIVTSKREFADTLRGALRNTGKLLWSEVRPNTHEKFIQGTLKRYKLYLKAFQIIMEEDGNKRFCPELEGKDYGLVQIFLDMFEYSYVKTVLAEIPRVKGNKYANITEFLDVFVKHVNGQYEASRALRSIPYEGADFSQVPARAIQGRGESSKPWQSGTDKKPWSKD
jgi:hypothetical protein